VLSRLHVPVPDFPATMASYSPGRAEAASLLRMLRALHGGPISVWHSGDLRGKSKAPVQRAHRGRHNVLFHGCPCGDLRGRVFRVYRHEAGASPASVKERCQAPRFERGCRITVQRVRMSLSRLVGRIEVRAVRRSVRGDKRWWKDVEGGHGASDGQAGA
jgi:hypothetical protein